MSCGRVSLGDPRGSMGQGFIKMIVEGLAIQNNLSKEQKEKLFNQLMKNAIEKYTGVHKPWI